MDRLQISVIVITRNQAEGLPVMLAHLEQQTFPAARFEIITVDTGSSDHSAEVAQRFADGAPVRTRCFRLNTINRAAARNLAVNEAQGDVVLFVDAELLAGPELLVHHWEAQRDFGGDSCVVGAVDLHPQMDAHVFTCCFLPEERRAHPPDSLLPYLEWRHMNCSLPRQLILDAGGYDETFSDGHFEEYELAYRLSARGQHAHYLAHAHAYLWRGASLAAERRRFFERGRALLPLAEKTNARDVYARFRVRHSLLRRMYDSGMIPFYLRAAEQSEGDTRIVSHLYRRVLLHEMSRGYTTALRQRGLAPR